MEVKQPRERLGMIEAIAGGFIFSAVISFFLFFFIRGWAVLFFFAFLAAYLVYALYNPKLKPGVSVVMSATPSRKVYDLGNPKGSYEEKKYRLAPASPAPLGLGGLHPRQKQPQRANNRLQRPGQEQAHQAPARRNARCSHRDLNPDHRLRKPTFYPSYTMGAYAAALFNKRFIQKLNIAIHYLFIAFNEFYYFCVVI